MHGTQPPILLILGSLPGLLGLFRLTVAFGDIGSASSQRGIAGICEDAPREVLALMIDPLCKNAIEEILDAVFGGLSRKFRKGIGQSIPRLIETHT